jgi:hypothetical protein
VTGFAYFYRTYTTTVSGSARKRVRCEGCSMEYGYEMRRIAQGGGHSAFGLTNSGAAAAANERARTNLAHALDRDIEAVFCPKCGLYQSDMVALLRKRLGPKIDPNAFASVRATIPVEIGWREARAADELALYQRFVEIWPGHSSYAEQRIRELKYPTLRRTFRVLFWSAWGLAALTAVTLVAAPFIGPFLGWK